MGVMGNSGGASWRISFPFRQIFPPSRPLAKAYGSDRIAITNGVAGLSCAFSISSDNFPARSFGVIAPDEGKGERVTYDMYNNHIIALAFGTERHFGFRLGLAFGHV